MSNKRMQTFSLTIITLISIAVILFVTNRYFYSWAGLISNKVGFCEYKTVSVPGHNGYPKQMSFRFDPQIIAREMSKNKNYQVNDHYNGNGALISRNFDGVIYKLYFENRGGSFEGFNLGTGIDDPGYDFPAVGGEKCTTPSSLLKKNTFTVIDDLPLTDQQKNELKKNVWVVSMIELNLF